MKPHFFIVIVWGLLPWNVAAQDRLIQFNGHAVATDAAATPVAFASVYNKSLGTGTVANHQGFFSLVARPGDTIELTSIGYKPKKVVVPDIGQQTSYTTVVQMEPDIHTLPETRIYPWISKEQFRRAFVYLPIPDDALALAQKNLDAELLAALGKELRDPDLRTKQMLQSYANSYYYLGQYQPMPILSPTAWMQFFEMLRSGAFRK
ncbi:MAG: carboxypeptidase-like regulatory domain-containing protein [Chitinophagales bacterium]|nr:carboxypeptidase-like regulatory domain-containing protein [Chitinophagales bacterium]MDW8428478.1 carboxypeptidase-like regulatory domain-containing protein [Chitinophagales bacterium]